MTKQPDSGGQGIEGGANASNSNNQPNQTGSSGEAQYVTVEQFNAMLNSGLENFRRSLQSSNDKTEKRLTQKQEQFEGSVKEMLQRAQRSGQSVGDLLEQVEQVEQEQDRQALRELTNAFREGKFPGSSQGSGQQGVNVSAIMAELELDANDPRVQAFRAQSFATEAEAYREASKVLKSMRHQPSDADAPSKETKRQTAPASNQDALMQEYQQRSKGVYGRQLLRLKTEMREKGLEIS